MDCRDFKCNCWWIMSLIPIFRWEIETIDAAKKFPTEGPIHAFMEFWSYPPKIFWLVAIFSLVVLIVRNWPKLNWMLVMAILSVGASDLISRRAFKVLFQRPRPGSFLTGCDSPSCWGFISSHSSNIAAMAIIFCLFDKRNVFWCLPLWIIVAGSRVYLMDHFPLDVLFGGLIGSFIGITIWQFGRLANKYKRTRFAPQWK